MPQSLRSQTLEHLDLRFEFLLGKAKLTPNADRWKQAGLELALVSLADLDEIVEFALLNFLIAFYELQKKMLKILNFLKSPNLQI